MKRDLHNIDKLFKKAIESHTEETPSSIWDAIENQLDKKKVASIEKKYIYLKKWAIALALFGVIVSTYALYTRNLNKKNPESLLAQKYENKTFPVSSSDNKPFSKKTLESKKAIIENKVIAIDSDKNIAVSKSNSIANVEVSGSKKFYYSKPHDAISNNSINILNSIKNKKPSVVNTDVNKKLPLLSHQKEKHIIKNIGKIMDPNKGGNLFSKHKYISDEFVFYKDPRIILLSALSSSALNQNSGFESLNRNKLILSKGPHFSIAAYFSSELTSNHIKDDHDANGRFDRDDYKKNESSTSSRITGIMLGYYLNSKWSISSGIALATTSTFIKPKTIFAKTDDRGEVGFQLDCSAGYSYVKSNLGNAPVIGDSAKTMISLTQLSYLSIPLIVNYHFYKGKFSFSPAAGISTNILKHADITTTLLKGNDVEGVKNPILGLRKNYMTGNLYFNIAYNMNKTFSLNFAPMARLALTPINSNTPVNSFPNHFGISAGISAAF